MTVLWGSNSNNTNAVAQNPLMYDRDEADVADTGLADVRIPAPDSLLSIGPSTGRPQLPRNQQPPPPHQPPPPPAPQQIGNPNDSLSLMQLKRIVTEFPRVEPVAYAFTYADTASYEEEIEEWFSYTDADFKRLRNAQETFARRWKKFETRKWSAADEEKKRTFIRRELTGLQATDLRRRCKSLQTLLHISLGVWDETASASDTVPEDAEPGAEGEAKSKTAASKTQIESIRTGVLLITECGGVAQIYELFRRSFDRLWSEETQDSQIPDSQIALLQDELYNVTTIIYVLIESARSDEGAFLATHKELINLNPELVNYLGSVTAKLRWDDGNDLPQTRIFLLFWKSLLLVFGGLSDINEAKKATSEKLPDGDSGDLITASPLDYHLFRQEITSKYPAYVPPAPPLPLELDNNSILPPLPNHPVRNAAANGILTPANANSGGGSILHQPVHIATPAPSPPPSPPVGGKAGKKQNYQTNQNFPFMYPPLDSTSNSAGGKGVAGLQEMLVGRKWEGSDIPASILEAGELFANRTRMTRAMRQLWDERERYLKFERGWDGKEADDDIEELDLESVIADKLKIDEAKSPKPEVDYGPRPVSDKVKARLVAVDAFYSFALPHLQSLVIVLLKAILANVTALIMQPMQASLPANLAPGFQPEANLRVNGAQAQRRPQEPLNTSLPVPVEAADLPLEDLDAFRTREVTAKAVAGILLTILKWFKVSHILKFEYLTQLLLDSNYLPLVLKLFAHQEVDRVVDTNSDRPELNFFAFCNLNSSQTVGSDHFVSNGSEDDAAPPPIKLRRGIRPLDRGTEKSPTSSSQEAPKAPKRDPPEIDELGYPVNELPAEPKTDFSWRNFFSSINYLRIMQKICKNKAHRNLLLVQYKSSNILKKALKIPQHELRLYTLKLFKNQVPYCGRKWRQGNMRVITAVYLHCRPELRDDWLAGSDVDAEVEEALPLEQALRALTHWFNIKRYPEPMGADAKILEEEHDFFLRELGKLDFGPGPGGEEGEAASVEGGEWAAGLGAGAGTGTGTGTGGAVGNGW